MNLPLPRLAVVIDGVGSDRGSTAFLRGVAARLRPRLLLWMLATFGGAQSLGWLTRLVSGLPPGITAPPPDMWKTMLMTDAVFIAVLTLAALVADESVARGARRWTAYLAALLVGCALAAWLQWELRALLAWQDVIPLGLGPGVTPVDFHFHPLKLFPNGLVYGTLAYFIYVNRRTARLAADRMRSAELARAQSRRRTLESRLQAMQARVEPQFLFNTLAQVGELYERDPERGSRMLDDLIAYLRAALPHLRQSSSTLGREIVLARAYLDIMRVRLGERLAFEIDVPDAVKGARMPPMMLLPLIDHALVYGLQPADAHGSLRIATETAGGRLRLTIDDSGAGFVPGAPAGDLDSIAERLHALYGDDARFEIERMRERGTRATLEIPYEETEGK